MGNEARSPCASDSEKLPSITRTCRNLLKVLFSLLKSEEVKNTWKGKFEGKHGQLSDAFM